MKASVYKVRACRSSDLAWVADVQVRMAHETENLRLHRPTVRRGVKRVFKNPSVGRYWIVADAKNDPIGMCLTLSEWSDWRCREVLWIHSVYVEPEHRGRGVYKHLYNHLKNKVSKSSRYSGLRLYVDKKNKNAQSVYRKLGMQNHHYELFEWMKTF